MALVTISDLAGGVNYDKQDYEVPLNMWTDVSNVTFRNGKLQKALGYSEVYASPSCRPQWMIPYYDSSDGNYYWVYPGINDNDDGVIYSVTGTTHTNRTRLNADAAISAISIANPTHVTIASTTYNDGDQVTISGSDSTPVIDGTYTLTKVGATEFTIPVNVTGAGSAGTASIDSDYSPSATIPWNGGELNGLLVINNGVDVPQKWDRTSGTLNDRMEDLANWPANTKARIIRPFRDFLIAMDISVSTNTPARNPYKLMWSDAADPFTEPSTWVAAADNLAGDVALAEGGDVIIDGAPLRGSFIVYKENSTWIMRYVGGNTVFTIDRLFSEHGILAPRCFAEFGDGMHLVVTHGDVIVHDGNTAKSVANDIVRRHIFDGINTTYYTMAYCTPYYRHNEIWFCYSTDADAQADKVAIWNYLTGAWTFRDLPNAPHISYGIIDTAGTDDSWESDSGAWDADTTSWDTIIYNPSEYDLMMIERGATDTVANAMFHQIDSGNTDNGELMTCIAQRTGIDINSAGQRDQSVVKHINRLFPKIRGGPVRIRVGSTMSQTGPYSWGNYHTYDPGSGDYKVDTRVTGRFFGIEISSGTDVDWGVDAIEIDMHEQGDR